MTMIRRHEDTAHTATASETDAPIPEYHCQLMEVSVSFADRDVLKSIDVNIGPRDRLAVLGDNGSGKTTLLRLLAGDLTPDRGERVVTVPGAIAYAEQNPQFPREASVGEVIDSYHHRLRKLEQLIAAIGMRLERAAGAEADKLLSQLEQVTDLYEAADGYAVSSRLNRSLEQLGLGSIARDTPVWNLSGGQRSRLALACVLSSGAQLLLLDEPTNDLDDDALRWLDAALQGHRGALVVVSHDRVFLQRYARRIVLVEDGAVKHYTDGYQGFLRAKAIERASAIAAFEHWTEELERSETLVAKNAARVAAIPRKQEKAGFGHGAFRMRSRAHGSTSKIRQAKARIEELESSPAPKPAEKLEFRLPSVANVDEQLEPLLQVTDVARVNEPQIFVEGITVRPGERWLVGGANGAGKSTLLKVLAGELPVEQGEVARRPDLRIGWLRQELSDLPGDTVIEAYAAALNLYLDEAVEQMFSLDLFTPRDLLVHPRALSVGQRRRLELAIAVGKNVDLLLLDEPTNHLSPDLVEQLEEALVDYPGTVITVTHDRRWRNKLASHLGLKRLDVVGGVVRCE